MLAVYPLTRKRLVLANQTLVFIAVPAEKLVNVVAKIIIFQKTRKNKKIGLFCRILFLRLVPWLLTKIGPG